ncbi:MAG: pyruvate kinase [Candidatus Omnitrophica bacterium]|nr:pyruvate kinase [Candidatus Omnitrophota bacterium]
MNMPDKTSPRRTKIVATVGPACEPPKILKALLNEGVDVLRINTSHTTPEGLRQWIKHIRAASKGLGKHVPVLVDLQGPRVRTGTLPQGESILLKKGQSVTICSGKPPKVFRNGHYCIRTSTPRFSSMVKKGDPILIDNGLIDLRVVSVEKNHVRCTVIDGDLLGENKGINLPQAPMTLPALSKKDREILRIAAKADVDYIALSFVRNEQDVLTLKRQLKRLGKSIPVIAKIEKPRAVEGIDSIIPVSEGIMVARGDLGIELGVQKVPVIQKKLIEEANEKNICVITATQMLESMIEHSRPTRAEVSDVANAVLDGTDAVMLSGETSIGKYPVETVRMMSDVIIEAEKHRAVENHYSRKVLCRKDHPICAITHAAQSAAADLDAKAIVAFTRSGKTAILASKFERRLPILAFTPSLEVSRRLALFHGIIPIKIDNYNSTDEMLLRGEQEIIRAKLLKRGDPVVVVSGARAFDEANYMVLIHWIGKKRL